MHHCTSLSLGVVDLDLQTTWKFLADKLTCLCLHSSKHLLAGLDVLPLSFPKVQIGNTLLETRGSEKKDEKGGYTLIHIELGVLGSLVCK